MKMNGLGTVLVVAMALLSGRVAQAAVVLVQPAAADAVVRSSAEKRNFGSEPTLEIKTGAFGGMSEAYLRFDFPDFAQFADKVTLRLFGQLSSAGSAQVVVRSINDTNWDENSLAWKWRPEHASTVGTLQIVGVSPVWYELDLTQHAKAQLAAGKRKLSLALVPTDGPKITFQSREAESHRPELVISRPLFSAKVSFIPTNASAPTNYMADRGDAFRAHSRGHSYGWSADNRAFMRDRNNSKYQKDLKNPPIKSPDRRYDFLAYMDGEKMTNRVSWEIAVPNGSYRVKIVAGDSQKYDSIFGITAEGVVVVEGVPDKTKRWLEGSKTVAVSDGKLTIDNTPSSSNNKLSFVEIYEVEPQTLVTQRP
jgi:hypothetical protein